MGGWATACRRYAAMKVDVPFGAGDADAWDAGVGAEDVGVGTWDAGVGALTRPTIPPSAARST